MTESGYTAHMCLIVFDWAPGTDQWLTLSANRDEFFNRPARALQEWPEQPGLFAGQDLQQGGTWLGMTQSGRWAALTNVRAPGIGPENPRSRGQLVLDYLTSSLAPEDWLSTLSPADYAPFNLLAGTPQDLWYCGTHPEVQIRRLAPGRYGLSNAQLDTPWPKLELARQQLSAITPESDLSRLLSRREPFADEVLPETGVPHIWEKLLSAQFIHAPGYGTRCSTGIRTSAHEVTMDEVTWNESGEEETVNRLRFEIQAD